MPKRLTAHAYIRDGCHPYSLNRFLTLPQDLHPSLNPKDSCLPPHPIPTPPSPFCLSLLHSLQPCTIFSDFIQNVRNGDKSSAKGRQGSKTDSGLKSDPEESVPVAGLGANQACALPIMYENDTSIFGLPCAPGDDMG